MDNLVMLPLPLLGDKGKPAREAFLKWLNEYKQLDQSAKDEIKEDLEQRLRTAEIHVRMFSDLLKLIS